MPSQIIDGTKIAQELREQVAREAAEQGVARQSGDEGEGQQHHRRHFQGPDAEREARQRPRQQAPAQQERAVRP